MGYGELDQLCINTIRILAVSWPVAPFPIAPPAVQPFIPFHSEARGTGSAIGLTLSLF
jgi:hypothetical protein